MGSEEVALGAGTTGTPLLIGIISVARLADLLSVLPVAHHFCGLGILGVEATLGAVLLAIVVRAALVNVLITTLHWKLLACRVGMVLLAVLTTRAVNLLLLMVVKVLSHITITWWVVVVMCGEQQCGEEECADEEHLFRGDNNGRGV